MSTDEKKSEALMKGPPEGSLQWYLDKPEYKARFNQILGTRAPQFASALITIANSNKLLQKAEPRSLIAAGMIAATLDLPIDRNLGFAWIVPYRDNSDGGKQIAQFQMGAKGFIQLALRSGQYLGMNAVKVNEGALGRYDAQLQKRVFFDEIGDRIIDWSELDETKPAVGYAFAWKLVNGFAKIVYWSREKVAAHAEQYSQAHKSHINKGYEKGRDCRWCLDFDAMALKTVIMNAIRRWGIMRIEMTDQMRVAMERDQTSSIDIEAAPVYIDSTFEEVEDEQAEPGKANGDKAKDLTETLKKRREGAAPPVEKKATEEKPVEREPEPVKLAPEATPKEEEKAEPADTDDADDKIAEQRSTLEDLFKQVSARHSDKLAKERLEMATGFRNPARVKEEKLGAGIDVMIQAMELAPQK